MGHELFDEDLREPLKHFFEVMNQLEDTLAVA
jgi:hypothetical protein